jgi:hypothetical protein
MSNFEHDALEDLLRHASPRPAPESVAVAKAKAALREEWRDVTGKRQKRRRVMQYAIAATMLLGAFVAINVLRLPTVEVVQVASIAKSFGSVYLLGEHSELLDTPDRSNVFSGQTIVTGDEAGLALAWGLGGSLRVDENTRIQLSDNSSVYLEAGRIYFDSQNATLITGIDAGDNPKFTVRTDLGDVRHLGTQYMTEVGLDTLVVSVREGEVSIDGKFHDETVASGEQAILAGRQIPTILSVTPIGEMWDWINSTTPVTDVDGRSLHEFLVWVCREMGLKLQFEGQAEAVAHVAILKGKVDTEPADALRLRLATADLRSRIEGGVIYISDTR